MGSRADAEHYAKHWGEWYSQDLVPSLSPIKTSDQIVDIGCGTGYLLRQLRPLTSGTLIGVDPEPHILRIAKQQSGAFGGLRFVNATAENTGISPRSIDLITAVNSVREWPNLPRAIDHLQTLLVSRGRMVFVDDPMMPNRPYLNSTDLLSCLRNHKFEDIREEKHPIKSPHGVIHANVVFATHPETSTNPTIVY